MNNTNFINILLFPNQSLQAKIDQQFSFQHVEQEERSFSSYLIENHRCFSAILEEKEFEFKDKQKFHQILQISELEGKIRWIFILLEEQSYFSSNPDPISYEKKIKANGQALSENIRIIYFSQKQLKNTQLTIYLTQYSDLKKELEITPFAFQYVFEKPPLKGEQELLQKILAQFINLCEKISNFIIKLTTYKEMITLFKLLVYIRQSLFQEVLKRFQIKKDKKYLYLIYLKQQSDVLFILKKITNNIFEKLAQLYKSDVCYCQTCNFFLIYI